MSTTVSNLSEYCAHCGHLEPINEDKFETETLIFTHKDDCLCMLDIEAHEMFKALANAMTHMKMNDCLMRRAEDSIILAMKPFAERRLINSSHAFKWIKDDMRLK